MGEPEAEGTTGPSPEDAAAVIEELLERFGRDRAAPILEAVLTELVTEHDPDVQDSSDGGASH